jgi:TP901 family phage tail tape measure protein
MADIESNIDININTANALASLKALQNQISAFHASMAKGGAASVATSSNMQQNLINSINSTGNFTANLAKIRTSTEAFTIALEKNKLSMGEYFRYAGASSKTFGKLFTNEFNTINKVARERVKDLQTQYVQMGRDASGAMQAIKVRPLTLDMNDLGTKTAIAAQKQQILNQLLHQGSTNLLNFGKNTQWAGRQLMVGFTLPLGIFAGKAIQSFQQVEEAALKFRRVYGDLGTTISETNDMSQKVQDLAASFTKYGIAVKDTLEMAATAAATGTQGKALLDQIKAATDLAVLGSVTQEQALQTTISLQNAFGISSDQLSKKINFLNAVENQTVLSIEDMTVAIPKAAPVVKQLGGNVEDLAFFLTAMKEGGINASEGANALKSGLSAMINPTNTASKMLQGYGINLKGIVNADKGNLKKTVVDFATALDKLDPLKRAKAIEQLFGKFQFARISTLMKNVVDQNSQAGKVLGLANAGPEALQILSEREKKQIENSPAFQYKKAMEDFQRQMVPIGLQFVKLITPVMEFVNKLLEQFNNLGDGTKNFVGGLVVVLGGIAPVALMAFGLIANGVANLIKLFANIKSFFNRTQTATQTLGETTNYLTQQQVEAAAVAASLEQSHMKLTQAFTSEKAAVNQLAAAYERAIAAQNGFRGTPGRPIPKPKGYATGGIINGPGTGTSDSILARVSNGEAIIPAKSVARNPQLISQLVSGNIPGFAEGTEKVKDVSIYGGSQRGLAPYTVKALGNYAGGFGLDRKTLNSPGLIKELTKSIMVGTSVESKTNISQAFIDQTFSSANKIAEKVAKLLETTSLEMGEDAKHISDVIKLKRKEIDKIVAVETLKLNPKTAAHMQKASQTLLDPTMEDVLGGGYSRIAAIRFNPETGEVNRKGVSQFSNKTGKAKSFSTKYKTLDKYLPSELGPGFATQAHLSPENLSMFTGMAPLAGAGMALPDSIKGKALSLVLKKSNTYLENVGEKVVESGIESMSTGAKKKLEIQSPSKKLDQVGKDAAQGLLNGVSQLNSEMKQAGQKQAKAFADGAAQVNGRRRVTTQSFNDAQEKAAELRRQQNPFSSYNQNPTNSRKRMATYTDANGNIVIYNSKDMNDPRHPKNNPLSIENVTRINNAAASANPLLTPAGDYDAPIGPQLPPKEKEKFKDKLKNKLKGAKSYIASGAASRGIGSAVMMGSMASGMLPGELGAQAQQIMGPLMSVGMAFTMMPPQIAAVVAALGLVTYGFIKFDQDLRQAAQDGRDLGKAMTMTNDKLTAMSEVTKTVSATELRKSKDANDILGIKNKKGQDSFGTQYLTTDAGTSMLNDIQTQLKNGQTWSQISSTLATEFSTAIQQGILTDEQAKSIANGLGQKLKNYKLSVDINANLIGMTGGSIETNAENTQKSLTKQTDLLRNKAINLLPKKTTGRSYSSGNQAEQDKAVAAATTITIAQIQNNQQLLDGINLQYDAQIKVAEAKAKASVNTKEEAKMQQKLLDLENKKDNAIKDQVGKNSVILKDAVTFQKTLEDSNKATQFNDSIQASINNLYKDADPATKAIVDLVSGNLKNMTGSKFKTTLQFGFASGEFSAETIQTLMNFTKTNQDKVSLIIDAQGTASTQKLLDALSASDASGTTISTTLDLVKKDPEKFDSILKAFQVITNMKASGINININTTGGQKQLQSITDHLAVLKDYPEKLTKTVMVEMKKKNSDEYNKIIQTYNEIKASGNTVTQTLLLEIQTISKQDVLAEYYGATANFSGVDPAKMKKVYAKALKAYIKKHNLGDLETDAKNPKTPEDPNQTKVDKFQTKIDYYQAKIGRIQDGLNILARSEDKINKKYDVRLKALQDMQKINDQINQQKQGELDIADALSKGDIAAATRAALSLDNQIAQNTASDAQAQLEKSRQSELGNLVGPDGKTRAQSQNIIDKFQQIIDEIHYYSIAPLETKIKGKAAGMSIGGLVPKYFARGGFAMGTDTVPAMLTPGEFVIKKSSVDKIGVGNLHKLNGYANGGEVSSSAVVGDSVYNYSINVNVATDSNPNDIARTVMTQIRQIDNQRLRGSRI